MDIGYWFAFGILIVCGGFGLAFIGSEIAVSVKKRMTK